jgi:hypothetical protein
MLQQGLPDSERKSVGLTMNEFESPKADGGLSVRRERGEILTGETRKGRGLK